MTATPTTSQLQLDGQAAAPDGPVDLAAMYVMHRAFRRDLDAFERAFPQVAVGDRRRWARLATRFGLLAMVLHAHHRGEDVGLWPLLAERGADREVLEALEADHALVDPLLAAIDADLATLAEGSAPAATKDHLLHTHAELRDALGTHLAREEREGMALVQAHLTQEDWDRLDREVFSKDYRPRQVPEVLGWVMSGLPPEAARRIPGADRALFRAFGRAMVRRFERKEVRTFDTRPDLSSKDRALTEVSKVVGAIHVRVLRASGWRVGARWLGGDVLLLTHTGRRSGRSYTTPLLHVRDGDDMVVAASNGGIDREPQWWLNLQADAVGVVEVAGRSAPVVARPVDEADRDRLWTALMAKCGSYDGYQASVSRQIALVRLTPTAG